MSAQIPVSTYHTKVSTISLYCYCITFKAKDIPLHQFLPSPYDYEDVEHRMVQIVVRLLVDYIPFFKDVRVQRHIPHQYSPESAQKSQVVSVTSYDNSHISVSIIIMYRYIF